MAAGLRNDGIALVGNTYYLAVVRAAGKVALGFTSVLADSSRRIPHVGFTSIMAPVSHIVLLLE
jgi:hypothetical protein